MNLYMNPKLQTYIVRDNKYSFQRKKMCTLCGNRSCRGECISIRPCGNGGGCNDCPPPCPPPDNCCPTKCIKYKCHHCCEYGTIRVPISCPAYYTAFLGQSVQLPGSLTILSFNQVIATSQPGNMTFTVPPCHSGMYNITAHIGIKNTRASALTVNVDIRVNGIPITVSNDVSVAPDTLTTTWVDITINYPLYASQTVTVGVFPTAPDYAVVDPMSNLSLVETVSFK